jgi:predicted DNA-binding transcriptional regulator AlpA
LVIRKEDGTEFGIFVDNSSAKTSARRAISVMKSVPDMAGIDDQQKPPGPVSDRPGKRLPVSEQPRQEVTKTSGHRRDVLPASLPPRGLSRVEAAAYVGVSPSLFDEMVKDGRMPEPKRVNARVIWDRLAVDAAFTALPEKDEVNEWDNR